jgi:4'-phosphopantetheinyl transferase
MDTPPVGTCEVWVARVSAATPYAESLSTVVSAIERGRVARLLDPHLRNRALASFGLLRLLLGGYLTRRPGDVVLDRSCTDCDGPHGRPRLVPDDSLQFSVAHSGNLLVFAFAQAQPVGVDVEAARGPGSPPPSRDLLDAALTGAERRYVDSVPAGARWPALLRYWTQKEAVLKSIGTGLSINPACVELAPSATAQWARFVAPESGRAAVWVSPVDVGGDPAAVASPRALDTVVVRRFTCRDAFGLSRGAFGLSRGAFGLSRGAAMMPTTVATIS